MIYLRFEKDGRKKYGVLDNNIIFEITPGYFSKFKKTGKKYKLETVKLLAPAEPTKIIALGLNYQNHAKELKMSIPKEPLIFLKAPSSVIGPDDEIRYPKESERVDYEAELAVVIKKKAKDITADKAPDFILGYTCLNDVTARDLQKIDSQWARSKSFDTFAPMGPWIVSGINPENLHIKTLVNGKILQDFNTRDMIFKVNELVAFISKVMTLLPGDVISTGTPPGVGPLVRGDKVKIRIEKIGELSNTVI